MSPEHRPRQHYVLRVADRAARYLEVELTVDEIDSPRLRLWMAAWVPGSYLMREYAGQVVEWSATDGDRTLEVRKLDKATWEIETGEVSRIHFRYRVYAPELTVRTADLTHDHAFVHPPAVFMAVEGREDEPLELGVDAPEGWEVATSLLRDGERWLAEDVDRLLDCPLEIGIHERRSFEAAGRPHEFLFYGSGNHDPERIVADSTKICEEAASLFGEVPFDRYLFILHLVHDRGGGLEHMDSTALAWPKLDFRPEKKYHRFLTIVAHEYFHVWNVKRIRPSVLWNYRYDAEVYTRLLWVFEGITSYYDELIPMRAGCYGPAAYGELMGPQVLDERRRPGRDVQSLSDSSFDTWIKLYRPTPDTLNSQSSYYQRGSLVAWLLDMHLRRESGGERSLDDLMRHLWKETFHAGRGIEEDEMASLIHAATGVDVEGFLAATVDSTGELDFESGLATVGLTLEPETDDDAGAAMSAHVSVEGGSSRLAVVLNGGAAHAAGLMADDVVVALDGHRVRGDLEARLKLYRPGETARWTAFRRDRLIEGEITFEEAPPSKLKLVGRKDASEFQKREFERWSKSSWDALSEA